MSMIFSAHSKMSKIKKINNSGSQLKEITMKPLRDNVAFFAVLCVTYLHKFVPELQPLNDLIAHETEIRQQTGGNRNTNQSGQKSVV